MSEDPNPLLAFKHAWAGAVAASEAVREMAPAVAAIDLHQPRETLDWETYHRIVLAQSNAVMALRGLIEQLRPRETTIEG